MTNPKPQAKRIAPKLKSQIISEILSHNSSISKIAKKYDLSSPTLYCWRIEHIRKMTEDLKNSQELSKESKNSFIELIVPESPQRNDDLSLNNFPSSDSSSHKSLLSTNSIEPTESLRPANSKLSAISLTFNHNISLSITGDIKSSSLIKILAALEEELEEKLEEKEGKSC